MIKPRIEIPANPTGLVGLVKDMEDKHDELGEDSPLDLLDWKPASPQIKEADAADKKIADLTRETNQLVQRRDLLVAELSEFVRQGRDILTGVHRRQMRKLKDFGFDVADTPRSKKTVETKKAA